MATETASLLKAAFFLMAGEFFLLLPFVLEFLFQKATTHISSKCWSNSWKVTQHGVVYVATKKKKKASPKSSL